MVADRLGGRTDSGGSRHAVGGYQPAQRGRQGCVEHDRRSDRDSPAGQRNEHADRATPSGAGNPAPFRVRRRARTAHAAGGDPDPGRQSAGAGFAEADAGSVRGSAGRHPAGDVFGQPAADHDAGGRVDGEPARTDRSGRADSNDRVGCRLHRGDEGRSADNRHRRGPGDGEVIRRPAGPFQPGRQRGALHRPRRAGERHRQADGQRVRDPDRRHRLRHSQRSAAPYL